jgi:hypothetical protein
VSTEYATLDDWELTSSPQPPVSSFTPRTAPNAIFTPTAAPDLHCKPALLALPPHPQTPKNGKRKCDISSLSSNQDRLKLTCHHGPGPTELHEVEVPLNALPSHPDDLSPLESYAEDLEQTHERIAMGLERIPSHALLKMGLVGFRRAADTTKKSTRTRRVLATPRCRSGRGRRDVPDRDGEGEGKEEKEKEKTPPL